jgi:hypothetical protein
MMRKMMVTVKYLLSKLNTRLTQCRGQPVPARLSDVREQQSHHEKASPSEPGVDTRRGARVYLMRSVARKRFKKFYINFDISSYALINMSSRDEFDSPDGEKVKARKVVEEQNPFYAFGEQVKAELMDSGRVDASKIQPMNTSLFTGSQESKKDQIVNAVKGYVKIGTRLLVFILLVLMLYSWNLKLFNLGDFQKISTRDENCSVINRFDFTALSWHEELTTNNMQNLEAQEKSRKKNKEEEPEEDDGADEVEHGE